MLNDPQTSSKTYLSTLKYLHNGNKISLIPPLLGNNCSVSNFRNKANHVNEYFNAQRNPSTNNSSLPSSLIHKTNLWLSSISFTDQDVLKTRKLLNVSKVHGYDDISIRVLKICDSEIVIDH